MGAVTEMSVADNAILGSQRQRTTGLFLDRRKIREHAERLVARFGVRASSIGAIAGKLSGGNLQKLILGREILQDAAAIVVEQPTRGLDVGAVESVWLELLRERERGKAILLISAELEELMNLADRIAVMFEGRIVGILDAASVTQEKLGLMISGVDMKLSNDVSLRLTRRSPSPLPWSSPWWQRCWLLRCSLFSIEPTRCGPTSLSFTNPSPPCAALAIPWCALRR